MTQVHGIERRGSLVNIYGFDAVGSAGLGLMFATMAPFIVEWLGTSLPPVAVVWLGIALIGWAGFNAICARIRPIPDAIYRVHLAVDWGWVLASLVLVAFDFANLTLAGAFLVPGVALFVAGIILTKMWTQKRNA